MSRVRACPEWQPANTPGVGDRVCVWRGVFFGRVERVTYAPGGLVRYHVRTDRGNLVTFGVGIIEKEKR